MDDYVSDCSALWSSEYEKKVIDVLKRGKTGQSMPREEYHFLTKYSLVSMDGVDKVTKKDGKYMVTKETVVELIRHAHTETLHGGEKKTHKKLLEKYANISRSLISSYISRCARCVEKRSRKETASGVVVKPLSARDLNERGQVDLVDMQTNKDGGYRFILHYQEYLTSFTLFDL